MKNYNWPVVGHHKIVEFLQKNIESNNLAHAYLFSGKEHLGKSLIAENFIASILCNDYHQKNQIEIKSLPCRQCIFCSQLAKGIHLDVYYLKREEDKKNISVEQVREMQRILNMSSFLNSYKIALIESAEDLNESAQNALLKILEEPKPKTIFILLTADFNLLLPTITSRCQTFNFLPLATDEIFHHLISLGATRTQARLLAAMALGQIGLAINYYKRPELLNSQLEKNKQFFEIFNDNLYHRFKIFSDLVSGYKNNQEISEFLKGELETWQIILRDIVMAKINSSNLIANLTCQKELEKLAQKYTFRYLLGLLEEIKKTRKYLTYNINPHLAIENLILNFSAEGLATAKTGGSMACSHGMQPFN